MGIASWFRRNRKAQAANYFICDYSLLVLDLLMTKCATLEELRQAIADYPENTHREGHVVNDMQRFVACFSSYASLRESAKEQLAARGGREYLESYSDQMELNEFLCGWDEHSNRSGLESD
jgi:hypothetical protein